jgi:hypothetical protein
LAKQPLQKQVAKAVEVVSLRQSFIQEFEDFDDFIFRGEDIDSNAAAAVEHNLRLVRADLARILWSNDVFIGIDIIDRVLFDLVAAGQASTLVPSFLNFVQEKGIYRPGFVVYPLHSFGVLGLGFYRFFEKTLPHLTLPAAGLSITAQTNSKEGAMSFLENTRISFGIKQRLPDDILKHFMRSRPLSWIEHNPLMAVRVRSFTGTYYENQFIYMLKLRMSTALIMMLSVMEIRPDSDDRLTYGSTSRVNNWQTLDIKHYLTFETPIKHRSVLSAYCIPMNVAWLELAMLSDLNVNIDPRAWTKAKAQKRLTSLYGTVSAIEKGFLQHSMLANGDALRARVYRKMLTSVDYFRRSFSAGFRHSEAVVSLAIAFETLLTDFYAPGVTERILRRVRLCLKGVDGTRRFQAAVTNLFECRGAIVHQGTAQELSTMTVAHQAYVLCLQHVVFRLSQLPKQGNDPIGQILGD